jgi:hypothetical protein
MAQIGPACGAQEPVRGATTYCTHSMQYHIARRTRPCHESPPLVGAQQAATLLPWPGNGDGHSLCWARSPMTATGGAHQGLGVARRGALSRPGSRPAPSGLPRAARPYSTGRAFAESQRYVPIDSMRTPGYAGEPGTSFSVVGDAAIALVQPNVHGCINSRYPL